MTEIITALLPLALKIITMALEKHVLDQKQKQTYLDFIQAMAEKDNMSTKARDEFRKLRDKFKSN